MLNKEITPPMVRSRVRAKWMSISLRPAASGIIISPVTSLVLVVTGRPFTSTVQAGKLKRRSVTSCGAADWIASDFSDGFQTSA